MQAKQRKVTSTRHEYVLPATAHCNEVVKAINVADGARNAMGTNAGVWVTGNEEEIVVYWISETVGAD